MAIVGIYGLLDPNTGHLRYIGLSKNIEFRYKEHCRRRSYPSLKHSTYLTNWLNSFENNPELIILEICSINEAPEVEQFWIAYYKSIGCKLVNLTEGGEGILGYKHSSETFKKMEHTFFKKGHITWNKGKKTGPSWNSGKKIGPNPKVSAAQRGRKQSPEQIEKRTAKKRIKVIDNLGNIFNSIKEAAKFYDIQQMSISNHINKNTKIRKGLTFKKI